MKSSTKRGRAPRKIEGEKVGRVGKLAIDTNFATRINLRIRSQAWILYICSVLIRNFRVTVANDPKTFLPLFLLSSLSLFCPFSTDS